MLFLATEAIVSHIPRLLGPGLSKAGKFPTLVIHEESLEGPRLLSSFNSGGMEERQVFQNVQLSVTFLVSLLKKNWQNVSYCWTL